MLVQNDNFGYDLLIIFVDTKSFCFLQTGFSQDVPWYEIETPPILIPDMSLMLWKGLRRIMEGKWVRKLEGGYRDEEH